MLTNEIKRGIYIAKQQGIVSALQKGVKFIWAKTISNIGAKLYVVNSDRYWDFRMKYDWNFVGGDSQTMYFTAGLFANVKFDNYEEINTILDYGCATGDSSIILKIFFPKSKIFLFDISKVGLSKALLKYSRFIPVERHDYLNKYDFVYSSNVIEHVDDPREFVNKLIKLTKKYIVIQCPWNEMHPVNNRLISPENQTSEHKWTINNVFFNKYIEDDRVDWVLTKGVVPMAWQGGTQAFFYGKIKEK